MTRDPEVLLRHILLCVDRIDSYTAEGKQAFFDDPKTQDAVIRNLEIIGQAVRDLGPADLARCAPGTPWQQIAGLRNVLAHQYLGVDLVLLWNVVQDRLPALRDAAEALLANRRNG